MEQQLEALSEASQYIERLGKGIYLASTHIKEDRIPESYKLIAQISEGLEWLQDILKLTQDIQYNEIDIHQVDDIISQLVEGMENEDWLLVSEVLEFELIEVILGWKEKADSSLKQHNYQVGV